MMTGMQINSLIRMISQLILIRMISQLILIRMISQLMLLSRMKRSLVSIKLLIYVTGFKKTGFHKHDRKA